MNNPDFEDFIRSNTPSSPVRIPTKINQRWAIRIVEPGLQGSAGAQAYLERYGRGIGAKKVIHLALKATVEGDREMAAGFWAKAYFLTFDEQLELNGSNANTSSILQAAAPSSGVAPRAHDDFGEMQPGNLTTMQAVDASHERSFYVENESYIGQIKHNGHRAVLFVDTDGCVQMQMRSLNMRPVPAELEEALLHSSIEHLRPFILDGELLYLDVEGREHQTAAAAAEIGGVATLQYMPFQALMINGQDLRKHLFMVRVGEALNLVGHLNVPAIRPVHVYPNAVYSKQDLCDLTLTSGMEGEVWTNATASYTGGENGETCIRTKHLFEGNFVITGFTDTTAAGREFGAIEISDLDGGRIRGRVGTGYSRADQIELVQAGVGAVIHVRYQSITNSGKLVHARYLHLAISTPNKEINDGRSTS